MTKHQNKREMNLRKFWEINASPKLPSLSNKNEIVQVTLCERGIYVLNGRVEIAGGEKRQNNVTIMMIKNLVKISIIKKRRTSIKEIL